VTATICDVGLPNQTGACQSHLYDLVVLGLAMNLNRPIGKELIENEIVLLPGRNTGLLPMVGVGVVPRLFATEKHKGENKYEDCSFHHVLFF